MSEDDFRSLREPVDSQSLNVLEKEFKRAMGEGDVEEALHLYVLQFGGYRHLAWRLGDYKRGLRLSSMLTDAGGIELQGVFSTRPWLEQSLFYLDTGQPQVAEDNLRKLLDYYKTQVARREEIRQLLDQKEPISHEILEEFAQLIRWLRGDDPWTMYEANLLQSICDALIVQGRLAEAEEIAADVTEKAATRDLAGMWLDESGANPLGRLAVTRFLLGKTELALADFEKAAWPVPARQHERRKMNGMHLAWHSLLLLRLGRLQSAGKVLRRCQYKTVKKLRPLLAAAYELTLAEYYLVAQNNEAARPYAQAAQTWAEQSGHRETYIKANLILARLQLRGNHQDAQSYLQVAVREARDSGYTLLLVDALVLQGQAGLLANQLEQGKRDAQEAFTLSSEAQCSYKWGQGNAANLLSELAYGQDELAAAQEWADKAIRIRQALQDPKVKNSEAILTRIQKSKTS